MTYEEAREILNRIEFRDWEFHLGEIVSGTIDLLTLQVAFPAPCSRTGNSTWQSGRKWRISRHSTPSELVQTALLAVLSAVEHEAREDFLYRGVAAFGPHLNVERLVEIADAIEMRI